MAPTIERERTPHPRLAGGAMRAVLASRIPEPEVSVRCSACQSESPPGARFCDQCGSALSRTCPGCGQPAAPAAKFCAECGARLGGAIPSGTPTPAPQTTVPRDAERRPLTVLFCD